MRVLCFYLADDYTDTEAADEAAREFGPEAVAVPVPLLAWRRHADPATHAQWGAEIRRNVARVHEGQ